ncbi:MAG TPA: energy transducer TonB [Gemmatimonadales bacterium]|nr:energy transducer TonB [Gemmatimonadales bacterium]
MFDTLIESNRTRNNKRAASVGLISIVIHTAVIAGAVVATWNIGHSDTRVKADTTMVFLDQQQQQKPPEQQPVQLDVPLRGFQTVVAPSEIPTDIPPINLQEHFDPKDYSGSGVEGGVADGVVPANGVYAEAIVEEKPEILSHPPLQYPELLRTAGMQGRVVIEAIVDTSGRVIPSSVRIVSSTHPGFEQPAKQLITKALFRPGRVHGRAVSVLLSVPVEFTLHGP